MADVQIGEAAMTPERRLLAGLRARAKVWRLEHDECRDRGDTEDATRAADTAWGIDEAIYHVARWLEREERRAANPRASLPAGQRRAQVARRKSATRRK